MSESLISALSGMLDAADIRRMTKATDAPDENILLGLKAALSSILGAIAGKVYDPDVLSRVFDLVSSQRSSTLSTSSESRKGHQLLLLVLGEDREVVIDEISKESSLSAGVVAQIMDLAAPMVLVLLGRRVREQRISLTSFPNLLLREAGDLSTHLPVSLSHLLRPPQPTFADIKKDASSTSAPASPWHNKWASVALIAILLPSTFWILRKSSADTTRARITPFGTDQGIERILPGNLRLRIPPNGMEAQLLSYLQDSSRSAGSEQWFDFDRVTFETNSAIPEPESEDQLLIIASILKAYPRVRLKIGGYTDNIGNRQANQRLSENRAEAVRRELVGMGIHFSRLDAEGYGEQYPLADNSTEQGRAKNRRLSVRVMQK